MRREDPHINCCRSRFQGDTVVQVAYHDFMFIELRKAYSLLNPPTRKALPFLLASFAGLALLDAASIGMVFPLMLTLIAPESSGARTVLAWLPLPQSDNISLILAILVVCTFALKNATAAVLVRWQYRVLSRAEAAVGVQLFRGYMRAPWVKINQRNSSEMIRNASVSVSHAFLSYIIPMITMVAEAFLILTVLVVLMIADARVALSAFGLLLVTGGGYYWMVRQTLARVGKDFQKANLNLLTHLKQGIGAGREIRVLRRDAQFIAELQTARDLYADTQARRAFFTQMPRFYLETVLVLGVMVGAAVALANRPPEEVGAVMALFGIAALRLMTSANRILGALQQIRIGTEPLRIVANDLETDKTAQHKSRHISNAARPESGVSFQDVTFAYDGQRAALANVSLHLPWNSSLGVIGPSGSGKSTLIDTLLGLLAPDQGNVLCDARPIDDDLEAWRKRIGFVPQSIYLTDDSLRRNVALGIPPDQIDEEAVKRALKHAQLEEMVGTLPQGLDTPLGDLGTSLSGGQRQRVGIARALYHNPDILVMDEATSALDSETEAAVVSAIKALSAHKTMIVVAHRLSTVRSCDQLLVLDQGHVTGSGSFEELSKNNMILQRMLSATSE